MNICDLPDAVISEDGKYRYFLRRTADDMFGVGAVTFLMLNPSTADATLDDPTIRRCIGFAKAWGKARLYVCNLSPLRATDPNEMLVAGDEPEDVKSHNLTHITACAAESDIVVAAYGTHGTACSRNTRVLARLLLHGVAVHCIGTTKGGHPRHPLYVSAMTELQEFQKGKSNLQVGGTQ